jgi:dTDP-4-amino-4,6-dideoxygalactose transaminase
LECESNFAGTYLWTSRRYGNHRKIAKKYNLWVFEYAAEARGAEAFGKKAGSFGDISYFSFICEQDNYHR